MVAGKHSACKGSSAVGECFLGYQVQESPRTTQDGTEADAGHATPGLLHRGSSIGVPQHQGPNEVSQLGGQHSRQGGDLREHQEYARIQSLGV